MKTSTLKKDQLFISLAGIVGLFASLGLGRFSLGMMLPAMGEGLGLSYSQMGIISTINFCGYLSAVLLSGACVNTFGSRKVITVALFLVAATMILIGTSSTFLLILFLYFLTGIGSALSNVPIMGLISIWFKKKHRGRIAGLFVMGNGLGILLTGKLVPYLSLQFGGWRSSWFALGFLASFSALLCFLLLKDKKTVPSSFQTEDKAAKGLKVPKTTYYQCAVIYFLFGFTYVIFVTFFVSSLVQERGLNEADAGALWAWVGVISLVSGPLLGYFSDRCGRKPALMSVFFMQTIAYLLVAAKLPMFSVYLSLFFFGLVAWSIPTIISALVGDYAGAEKATAVFGFVTFFFGVGQIVGPGLAGILIDYTGGFSTSFIMAATLTILAFILSFMLPKSR